MIKKGDRVKVYATLNGVMAETKGTVIRKEKDGRLQVMLKKETQWPIFAHPKQCRKLVRKKDE